MKPEVNSNEVKFPSEIPIIATPADDDKILAARADSTYGSLTLGRIFAWLKAKFTAPLSPVKSIATLLALDSGGALAAVTPAQAATAIAEPIATPLAPILAPIIAPLLGIDHSLLTEQIVPGEYFLDVNGSRKQVYVRTFVTDSVVAKTGYGTFASGFNMSGVAGIISVSGTVVRHIDSNTTIASPVDRPTFGDVTLNDCMQYMPDFASYHDGLMTCNIIVVGPTKNSLVGQRIQMVAAVKYIKL